MSSEFKYDDKSKMENYNNNSLDQNEIRDVK